MAAHRSTGERSWRSTDTRYAQDRRHRTADRNRREMSPLELDSPRTAEADGRAHRSVRPDRAARLRADGQRPPAARHAKAYARFDCLVRVPRARGFAAAMCRTSRAAKRREQVIAGALAPAALLGGQTAVLMVMGVTLALRGARATRGQACLERRKLHVRVGVGLAAEDAAGVNARVGAIEAEPDAASQRFNIGLGEARVGADHARCGARDARVDARRERGDVGDDWRPMRSQDLFDAHVLSPGWMRFLAGRLRCLAR